MNKACTHKDMQASNEGGALRGAHKKSIHGDSQSVRKSAVRAPPFSPPARAGRAASAEREPNSLAWAVRLMFKAYCYVFFFPRPRGFEFLHARVS